MRKNITVEPSDYSWSPWRGKPRVIAKNWGDPIRWNKRVAPVHCKNAIGEKFTVTVRKPRIFPSLCDWLDNEVPIEWLARFLALIHDTPHLDWLLLTKRPENWFARLKGVVNSQLPSHGRHDRAAAAGIASHWKNGNLPHNVWFGVSVEDQQRADERIPRLLEIPARVRWLSVEPLLGPVNLTHIDAEGSGHSEWYQIDSLTGRQTDMGRPCPSLPAKIDWVVVGGESGPKARTCNVEWIRSIVSQCANAGVPCFVKQLGARPTFGGLYLPKPIDPKGGDPSEWPADFRVRQFQEVKP